MKKIILSFALILFTLSLNCYDNSTFDDSIYPHLYARLQISLNADLIEDKQITFLLIDNNYHCNDDIRISELKDPFKDYVLTFIITFENSFNSSMYYHIKLDNLLYNYSDSGSIAFNSNTLTIQINDFEYYYDNSYDFDFSFAN